MKGGAVADALGCALEGSDPDGPAWCTRCHIDMPSRSKVRTRTVSVRQSLLAQRGVDAESEARAHLKTTYRRFMAESDPERKNKAGKDLIRAIFGKDALAEDSVL